MEYCKLQAGCLLVIIYIAFLYLQERRRDHSKHVQLPGQRRLLEMAYNVALHHHEKWNGKGYPSGLKGEGIPLCARIMAIADVFDAVSETRCYRAAMPMEQCFDIIRQGTGQDFDPLLAQVFLDIRPQVESIHAQVQ